MDVIRAGLVDYAEAWQRQRDLHARRVAGDIGDTVLLLEHPPVYTAGSRTQDWERPTNGAPVIDVDRGGQITWHGPGQLVGYPIVTLPQSRDVVAYVRRMEAMLIAVCAEFGLAAERVKGRSGVWVRGAGPHGSGPDGAPGADRKVAALGIRVARGVTQHGFALNCEPDLSWYDPIVACGIRDASVTSLSRELGRRITVADALPIVERHLPALLPTPVAV